MGAVYENLSRPYDAFYEIKAEILLRKYVLKNDINCRRNSIREIS